MSTTIPLTPITSSQLDSIGHDSATKTLAIQFKSKGDKPGGIYQYENVTDDDFKALKEAPSIGSHFYKHIKPHTEKHPYVRVG